MSKQDIREQIWHLLESKNIADFPRPCYGRIPNFKGARAAAERIKDIPEFRSAHCVFCAPDAVLQRVREIVLEQGKVLGAALPHIAAIVEIREQQRIRQATTIKGMSKYGTALQTKVDLFVQGSVAVDRSGNRLGKGKGYGDQEFHILKEKQLLHDSVKVITIVHDLQIVDDLSSMMAEWDIPADYIITNHEILERRQ